MATVAPPANPLPETRLRASAVLTWPRLRPSAAEVADSVWQNPHVYDGLASGSIYFLSRDPAVSLTRSPYGYVDGNPPNASDPTGLGCSPNPFDWGACAADVWNHSVGSFDWGTTAAGVVNVVYGAYKIVTGVDEAAFSVALLFAPPPFNALAIPAGMFSVYQVTTGVAREVRGVRQLVKGFTHPATKCSVGDNTLRFAFGVLPSGGAGTDIWDWLGGGP